MHQNKPTEAPQETIETNDKCMFTALYGVILFLGGRKPGIWDTCRTFSPAATRCWPGALPLREGQGARMVAGGLCQPSDLPNWQPTRCHLYMAQLTFCPESKPRFLEKYSYPCP